MNDMTEQLSISYTRHLYGKVAQMDENPNEKIEIKIKTKVAVTQDRQKKEAGGGNQAVLEGWDTSSYAGQKEEL